MTDLITQIKQIIEDEAEKCASDDFDKMLSETIINYEWLVRFNHYKAGAEFLLPVLIKAIEQNKVLNNLLEDADYIFEGSVRAKGQTENELCKREKAVERFCMREKLIDNFNQELLNILKAK